MKRLCFSMGKLLVFVSPHGEFFNIKTDFPREEQKSFDRFGVLLEDANTIPSSEGANPEGINEHHRTSAR